MKLKDIAHIRTGDKGNLVNIAVIAYKEEDYKTIKEHITVEVVKDYDGVDRLFFFADILESNWKVGTAISAHHAIGVIVEFIMDLLIVRIIILVIFISITLYIFNSITKPIARTVQIFGDIANLDLSKTIDEKELKRKDELGQMYNSFKNTIGNLKVFMKEMENTIQINH